MKFTGNLGHLTYSTLAHPADTWVQLWDSVNRYLPAVKTPDQPECSLDV
jgi:hypothetical protein